MIHNWDAMFDKMKAINLAIDTSLAPEDRSKFFDDNERLRDWLRETEAWCRSANLAVEDLGDHHQMYMIWADGQYLW